MEAIYMLRRMINKSEERNKIHGDFDYLVKINK